MSGTQTLNGHWCGTAAGDIDAGSGVLFQFSTELDEVQLMGALRAADVVYADTLDEDAWASPRPDTIFIARPDKALDADLPAIANVIAQGAGLPRGSARALLPRQRAGSYLDVSPVGAR